MKENISTLDEFTHDQLRTIPHATGMLSALLRDIGLAAKRIGAAANQAGLTNILGATGLQNVHQEEVQQLDLYAHQQLRDALNNGHSCAGIVSEEMDEIEIFDNAINNKSKYVVAFDPLDGSSNIETNISIGTIFGVYKRVTMIGSPSSIADFLQAGVQQAAAGYIIYGSSTMLIYATRRGVNGFTLDPAIGEFCLSHPDIQCPATSLYYSVNQGYYFNFDESIQLFIIRCQLKGYSLRYTGSMVADFHRTLLKGGVFMYPGTIDKPAGKLRLLYECNPFAFIIEVAGGEAVSNGGRMLDQVPVCLHETTAIYTGSREIMQNLSRALGQDLPADISLNRS